MHVCTNGLILGVLPLKLLSYYYLCMCTCVICVCVCVYESVHKGQPLLSSSIAFILPFETGSLAEESSPYREFYTSFLILPHLMSLRCSCLAFSALSLIMSVILPSAALQPGAAGDTGPPALRFEVGWASCRTRTSHLYIMTFLTPIQQNPSETSPGATVT